ncbi:dihydrofolate reductase [bacterium]|nr:dihydrofolate reductase [bacterium]
MKLKSSVFIATSLDGFIAGPNGELDWLDAANTSVPDGEDCGFQVFMDSIDVLIMGKKTYEQVMAFAEWPYGSKQVIVLSRNKVQIPPELIQTVSDSSESPEILYKRLSSEGKKRLYIDGGITIQRFLAAGLINDLTITVIPVLLGVGIPLFGEINSAIVLKQIAAKNYDFGFVQLTYEVIEKDATHE